MPSEEPPTSARKPRATLWVLPAMVLTSLLIGLSGAYPAGSAAGEIRSTGTRDGGFVVRAATCMATGDVTAPDVWIITRLERTWGGKTGFTGGLLIQADGAGGWRAVLESPKGCTDFTCPQRPLQRPWCSVFDLFSEAHGWWWRRRGHARLECRLPEGGTLTANLSFHGCAHPMNTSGDAD